MNALSSKDLQELISANIISEEKRLKLKLTSTIKKRGILKAEYCIRRFRRLVLKRQYKAAAAETEYRAANLDSTKKAFALISLLNGEAVIKDVIIDDRSLKDWVKQRQQ